MTKLKLFVNSSIKPQPEILALARENKIKAYDLATLRGKQEAKKHIMIEEDNQDPILVLDSGEMRTIMRDRDKILSWIKGEVCPHCGKQR